MSETESRARRVWQLLPIVTTRDVRAQYRQSTFDIGWSLLTPMITVAGFGLVLSGVFGVEGDGTPYVTFAWAGVVVWTFVATGLTKGASSLVWSADLVRKVAFPKEVLPMAAVLSAMLDLGVGGIVLGVLMAVQGVGVTASAIALLPVIVVAAVWTGAVALLLATLTAFIRDVAHGLAVVLRVGIFVTPVMYPASVVPEQYRWLLDLNPVAVFVESVRTCLFDGAWPDWRLLGLHFLAAIALFGLGATYLRRVEGRIADVI